MIINELKLTNFCIYRGEHEFNLAPTVVRGKSKPVVLFGGMNGGGKTTILERVLIPKDGNPDHWMAENWNQLVDDLIPFGVAQLCFFDAEKIRFLAEDETSNVALGDAIKALLGLDLAERLVADSTVLEGRLAKMSHDQNARVGALVGRTQDTMREFLRRATERKIARLSDLVTTSRINIPVLQRASTLANYQTASIARSSIWRCCDSVQSVASRVVFGGLKSAPRTKQTAHLQTNPAPVSGRRSGLRSAPDPRIRERSFLRCQRRLGLRESSTHGSL